MQQNETINIFSFKERCFVQAIIVSIAAKHVRDFEEHWKTALESMKEEDKYWDWALKKRISLQDDNFESYALECDTMTQGLIMLETQWHYSQIDGKESDRIVYVEESRNMPSYGADPDKESLDYFEYGEIEG